VLTPEARHYLRDVLRLGPGAEVEVFDGRGGAFSARVDGAFEALVLGAPRATAAARAEIWLLAALAKGEKMDLVVQKATELGAAQLHHHRPAMRAKAGEVNRVHRPEQHRDLLRPQTIVGAHGSVACAATP